MRKDGGGAYVFTIAGGKIERKAVTIGASGIAGDEFRTEISSGLDFGTQVIRTDMGNLSPGTAARIAQPATPK